MAISTRKKNIIISMWKTGKFSSYTAIAKEYKISTKTAQKIIGENSHSNSDIVELGTQYEMAKNSTKNPHDINAIEKVIADRLKISNISTKILDGVEKMADKGTKQIVAKVKEYSKENGSSESLDVVDVELDASDYKNMQDTVDKASITLNVNNRHAPKIEITQQQLQTNNNVANNLDKFYEEAEN